MLLDFMISNYKSFAEEAMLSLEAAPKQSGLDYSLHKRKIGRKTYKTLCSAVLYGPNAAGKTAIIGALDTLKHIVTRGNVRDSDPLTSVDKAAFALSLIPNSMLANPLPVKFGIRFFEHDDLYDYALHIDLGAFLDSKHDRKVVFERLSINEREIFARNEQEVSLGDLDIFKDVLSLSFVKNEAAARLFASEVLADELFLTNGFKSLVSPTLSSCVTSWFEHRLTVVYRADQVKTARWVKDAAPQSAYIEKTVNDAAKIFGISSNALGYMLSEGESEPQLCSLFRSPAGKGGQAVNAEDYESYGTVRFVNLFPLVVQAIATGGVLVVDEFDASIHPMALMSIINVFHNDDINKLGAQLVFNTHNPVFLNKNVFRRDEIKFVERDHETGVSTCYSLSDFGTSGPAGVRKGDDYMKSYFVSRYGAIEDIDFTPLFEEIISDESSGPDEE
ncbi:MAG: ATP-binding protein [Raoultibacter sp.]